MLPDKTSGTQKVKILNRPDHTRSETTRSMREHGEGELGCGGPRDG